ncbi:hypothetical protein ColTof4_07807 [Colletotrichum tofieldiae]|nr:hypothetical protein ColTof3_02664 [Colletotrichum tofieldiae]GKT75385.1 hypothetical protein ColTof4_07807 [Colletotrichum tofieldiae]GKT83050.1 hypothetical protein Ct61P_00900 [Colletotrichum tofieldiae]
MASGKASNSCFVISAPKDPVDGDTGGGTIVADPAEDSVSRMACIVVGVAIVFLLPLLLLFSWLLSVLNGSVAESAVGMTVKLPVVPDSELLSPPL